MNRIEHDYDAEILWSPTNMCNLACTYCCAAFHEGKSDTESNERLASWLQKKFYIALQLGVTGTVRNLLYKLT